MGLICKLKLLLVSLLLFLGLGLLLFLILLRYDLALLLFKHLLEAVDASGRIYDFLLAGVYRVAGSADFDIDLRKSRFGRESVPADALYGTFLIFRVDIFFHINFLHISFLIIMLKAT